MNINSMFSESKRTFGLEATKRANPLQPLIERDTPLKKAANTGGGEWVGACPFCGGKDRFRVQPERGIGGAWFCRHCTGEPTNGGRWLDVIAYVQKLENLEFAAACQLLQGSVALPLREKAQPINAKSKQQSEPDRDASQRWQESAWRVVEVCHEALMNDADPLAEKMRGWLAERGIEPRSLGLWQLGMNARDRHIGRLWVPAGVVIPCIVAREVCYIKIRQLGREPKYTRVAMPKGVSKDGLFGAETLLDDPFALFAEGELDAILAYQAIYDAGLPLGVATLGSKSETLDTLRWGKYLAHLQRVFVAYDVDGKSESGATKLLETMPLAKRAYVPQIAPEHKDLTDYHCASGDLADWLRFELQRSAAVVDVQPVEIPSVSAVPRPTPEVEHVITLDQLADGYFEKHGLRVDGGRPPINVGDESDPTYTRPLLYVPPMEALID